MRLHRFYINKPLGEEIVVENSGSEKECNSKLLHQWIHVFRYTRGDEVVLFSDSDPGTDHCYRIISLEKGYVSLSLISLQRNSVPSQEVTLVMALVKKDTFETVARQATELGVSAIVPLLAARSEKKSLNMERLRAIVIEAAEQSGRGTIPKISEILTRDEVLAMTTDRTHVVGSLQGTRPLVRTDGKLALWVGPEGGWTIEEEEVFKQRGFTLHKLTDTTLKADTAAIALLTNVLSPLV